ncbi:heptosyltransferase III [Campylobacter pinnipediorum subsp. caledonicus]|uniref:putative lipopolysaccharide heptosyltransferase III n=1 Tax=Campylobacter pinnipediorum TaxID=1965231 RepID=UPI0009957A3B|nr:putative lipopolysaccharide heptosyltransferase III [Campylobacter pinnipediorum]AQW86534.1 heptosyltransferase III [Campylobacter pinnipediorum subsp. caledonicus]
MKILVMKFRNIGDVLLTTPLLSNLKHHFPDAQIDFALNKGCEAVLQDNPNINKIHIYDRQAAKNNGIFKRILTELRFIKAIKKEKYDIAIQTTTGDRGIIIAKYAKIKKIISFEGKNKAINKLITDKVLKSKWDTHTIDRNLEILKVLNLKPIHKKVEIFFDKNNINHLDLPENFIHVHLTSRWIFKCIKDETMAEIIDFCENKMQTKVVITADNNEIEKNKVKSVINICKSSPINLSGKLSLKQVAALNKKSLLFIGVDTAIMHIAAANDTPVIAFFGPSGVFEWGPWDNNLTQNEYKNINGNQKMGKHCVFQKNWDCVPCGQDGCNGSKISNCLMDFDIDDIKNAISSNIKNKLTF